MSTLTRARRPTGRPLPRSCLSQQEYKSRTDEVARFIGQDTLEAPSHSFGVRSSGRVLAHKEGDTIEVVGLLVMVNVTSALLMHYEPLRS